MSRSMCHKILVRFIALSVLFIFFSMPARAFYEWQGDESFVSITGMTQIYGMAYKRHENIILYEDNDKSGIAGVGRVIVDYRTEGALSLEANAYQTYIPMELAAAQSSGGVTIPDAERSSALEWSASEDNYIHTAVDRLNLRWSRDRVDLIIGRQPVNLATNYYFTPNDFFAAFAAQTFYRVYKPGVDAARAEVRLGNLSQLSLIGVLGYSPDENGDNGWSSRPETGRSSFIGRISGNLHEFEWALIAGVLADSDVIGGSLQGEMFEWLDVKAEAHVARPESPAQDKHAEVSLGIQHYWENSLDIRLEYFYHGSGYTRASDYAEASLESGHGLYLGRHYSALGIGYEFTPLLTGQMVLIGNLTDNSLLASFNAVYSLSNESELSFGAAAPFGREAEGMNIKSEFGMYPYSVNVEWRWYF